MKFLVEISPFAIQNAVAAFEYIALDSPDRAVAWYQGLIAAIDTLSSLPRRCRKAPESEALTVDVRQLMYGSHRILFTIEGDRVRVHAIRHAARRAIDCFPPLD